MWPCRLKQQGSHRLATIVPSALSLIQQGPSGSPVVPDGHCCARLVSEHYGETTPNWRTLGISICTMLHSLHMSFRWLTNRAAWFRLLCICIFACQDIFPFRICFPFQDFLQTKGFVQFCACFWNQFFRNQLCHCFLMSIKHCNCQQHCLKQNRMWVWVVTKFPYNWLHGHVLFWLSLVMICTSPFKCFQWITIFFMKKMMFHNYLVTFCANRLLPDWTSLWVDQKGQHCPVAGQTPCLVERFR